MFEPVERRFADSDALAAALAADVAARLQEGIAARGRALLAVSGGTTPRKFLALLGLQPLDWPRVTITLADERWVAPEQERSNERLVRETLLRGAAGADFVPLYARTPDPETGLALVAERVAALQLPFDAVVLGLGDDGHCASLFPDGDHFAQALDARGRDRVLPMRSVTAGEPRMTLTLPALAATRAMYLHIEGADKLRVLGKIRAAEERFARSPLRAILRALEVPLRVYLRA